MPDAPLPGWERLAREDPLRAIDPSLGPGADVASFRAAGDLLVEQVMRWAEPLPAHDRALEIGVGVGRNLIHLAERFAHVDGIDVSPTMLALAGRHGVPGNVALHLGSGHDLRPLPDASYDLVFSNLVLQHIASAQAVASYIHETARVLRPSGTAALQVDTRDLSRAARLARKLPRSAARRAMQRHPRTAAWVRSEAARAGLRPIAEHGDPANRFFVLRKPSGPGVVDDL